MMVNAMLTGMMALTLNAFANSDAGSDASATGAVVGVTDVSNPSSDFYANCDWRDARNFNGWGWNPVANASCPPRCDYGDADKNNGWGWDPNTQMSCAPR